MFCVESYTLAKASKHFFKIFLSGKSWFIILFIVVTEEFKDFAIHFCIAGISRLQRFHFKKF